MTDTGTRQESAAAQAAIRSIARRHLNLETLDTRHSDALDFHELATWNIREALLAAYAAGAAATAVPPTQEG